MFVYEGIKTFNRTGTGDLTPYMQKTEIGAHNIDVQHQTKYAKGSNVLKISVNGAIPFHAKSLLGWTAIMAVVVWMINSRHNTGHYLRKEAAST